MSDRPEPESFLPLSQPVFHILLAVADRQRHGYAILKEIARATGGRVKTSTGTLYAAIKRLLEDELIEESEERPPEALDDDRRRYYRITELGRRVVDLEAERMDDLASLARSKLAVADGGDGADGG